MQAVLELVVAGTVHSFPDVDLVNFVEPVLEGEVHDVTLIHQVERDAASHRDHLDHVDWRMPAVRLAPV